MLSKGLGHPELLHQYIATVGGNSLIFADHPDCTVAFTTASVVWFLLLVESSQVFYKLLDILEFDHTLSPSLHLISGKLSRVLIFTCLQVICQETSD